MSSVIVFSPKKLIQNAYSRTSESIRQPAPSLHSGGQIQAEAKRRAREAAIDNAVENLNKLMSRNNINVSLIVDASKGTKDVQITDMQTGNTIMRIPPIGVVEIAEKARQNQIGVLMDFFA